MSTGKGPPTAKPVAYMLVRSIEDDRSKTPRMRTKLGCGIVNYDTVRQVTEGERWHLGGIIGHFDTMAQAEGFVEFWKNGNERASRGPVPRITMGLALADILGVESWIDCKHFVAVNLQHFRVCLVDHHIVAYDLTDKFEPVKA